MIDTDQANLYLETLADLVLPPGKKGATSDIVFRRGLSMDATETKSCLVGVQLKMAA